MLRQEYKVSFVTPAFLGNAEQAGQWRTPPFKALLRQWWRVAETAGQRPDVDAIRDRGGTLRACGRCGHHRQPGQAAAGLARRDSGKG